MPAALRDRYGVRVVPLTVVVDVAKGLAAGFAGMAIGGDAGGYTAATTSIAGHIWPIWSRFRGGKGVATSAGACLAVFPAFFPIDVVVAMFGVARTRHPERTIWGNGVAWVGSAVVWWLADLPNLWGPDPTWGLVAFAAVSSAMIIWKFRASRQPRTIAAAE